MIIAFDIDGVLADLHKAWLGMYNQDYGDDLTYDDLVIWNMDKLVKPECGVKIFNYLNNPSLYDHVLPIPGGIEVVSELRSVGHRVIFVTATPMASAGRKFKWLVDWHFLTDEFESLNDYFECRDKSLIRANVLIDDNAETIKAYPGVGFLYNAPWNQNMKWPKRIYELSDIFWDYGRIFKNVR